MGGLAHGINKSKQKHDGEFGNLTKKHDLETMFILQRFGLVWNTFVWLFLFSGFRIEHN